MCSNKLKNPKENVYIILNYISKTPFRENTIGPNFEFFGLKYDKRKKNVPQICEKCIYDCDWYPENYTQYFGTRELIQIEDQNNLSISLST